MIDTLVLGLGSAAAAAIVAYAVTSIVVELLDRAGGCYSAAREARRHRVDAELESAPAWPMLPATSSALRFDLEEPVIRRAIMTPTRHATPLADRIRRQRIRRLVAVTGR